MWGQYGDPKDEAVDKGIAKLEGKAVADDPDDEPAPTFDCGHPRI